MFVTLLLGPRGVHHVTLGPLYERVRPGEGVGSTMYGDRLDKK